MYTTLNSLKYWKHNFWKMDNWVWIWVNVHEARPLTSDWMDCNWLILSSWLILQPAKLVGVSLADLIDKQRRGEGKVRRDSISARLKNLLSSRSLDKSLRISKPSSSRFGESSELELFDIREIENWSFVRNTTRPARIDADQRRPPGCAPIRSMHSKSHLNRHRAQSTKRLLSYSINVFWIFWRS